MASTIILSDNGASSGSAGLKQTAGNDGVLILQTTTSGGTATNAIYVDNAQNVGLGITPSATGSGYTALQVRSANVMSDGSATVLYNNAYYTGSVEKYIATGYANKLVLNNAANGSMVLYGTSSGSAAANITFTNILQVTKDATVALQGGTSSSGTGIAFPASQSASSNANTLDDYEEGTFTPTLIVDTGTPTYSYQEGRYTKIGNYVYGGGIIGISNSNTLTGGIRIQLPFTVLNTSYGMSAGIGTDGQGFTWPVTGTGGYSIYNAAFQAQPNTVTLQWYSVSTSATFPTYTSSGVASTWYMRFNFGFFTAT